MATAFAGPMKGGQPVNQPRLVRRINDDTAIVVSDIGVLLEGQTEIADDGHRVATWAIARSSDGRWRITAYHNCPAA